MSAWQIGTFLNNWTPGGDARILPIKTIMTKVVFIKYKLKITY